MKSIKGRNLLYGAVTIFFVIGTFLLLGSFFLLYSGSFEKLFNSGDDKPIVTNTNFKDKPIKINKINDSELSIDKRKKNVKINHSLINIAVTGVDSRIGERYKHADANHIISIDPKNKKMTIYSVPRDTETEYEMNDTTIYKLSDIRGAKGRKIYLQELCIIANISKIDHYAEFGFSQARGLLEWLGYKDAGSTLQVLRSRKVIRGDDFQRQYSQALFMQNMIKKHFSKLNSLLRQSIILGGLSIIDTDMSFNKAESIYEQLFQTGFPEEYSMEIKIVPDPKINYVNIDFENDEEMKELISKIQNMNEKKYDSNYVKVNINQKTINLLSNEIVRAEKDSLERPTQVINKLKIYFEQKAWLQISDMEKRIYLREQICNLLADAYLKKGQIKNAEKVKSDLENEKLLLENIEKKAIFLDSINKLKQITSTTK